MPKLEQVMAGIARWAARPLLPVLLMDGLMADGRARWGGWPGVMQAQGRMAAACKA